MSPLQAFACGLQVPALPAQLQPVTLAGAGLPGTTAELHAAQVIGGLQTFVVPLQEPLAHSVSAVHAMPVPQLLPVWTHAPVELLQESNVHAMPSRERAEPFEERPVQRRARFVEEAIASVVAAHCGVESLDRDEQLRALRRGLF